MRFSACPGKRDSKAYYKGYRAVACSTMAAIARGAATQSISSYIYGNGVTDGGEAVSGHRAGKSVIEAGDIMLFDFDDCGLDIEDLVERFDGLLVWIGPSKGWTPDKAKFHAVLALDRTLPMNGEEFERWYQAVLQFLGLEGFADPAMKSWTQQMAPHWSPPGAGEWVNEGGLPLNMDLVLAAYVPAGGEGGIGAGEIEGEIGLDTVFTLSRDGEELTGRALLERLDPGEKVRVHCIAFPEGHDGGRQDTALVRRAADGYGGFYYCAGGRCGKTWALRHDPGFVVEGDGVMEESVVLAPRAPVGRNAPTFGVMTPDEMQARFIFLTDGSRVYDRTAPAHTLSFSDFKAATAASKMDKQKAADVWLGRIDRVTAYGTTFKPGGPSFMEDPDGRYCVNTWRGWRRPGIEPGDPTLFIEHVRFLFADRSDDFINWLAHIEQNPGVLPHTAWLHISSSTGTGRGMLASILDSVWNNHVAEGLDLMVLLDKGWNQRLSCKVLATVDEIKAGGNTGKWQHTETLKQMITAPKREISAKYGRASTEYNCCRFLIFSNHRAALPLDDGERRFEVVINDGLPMGEEYYSRLSRAMSDPSFIAGVGKFLAERDIGGFNPGAHAKRTHAKEQVISTNRSHSLSALLEFNAEYGDWPLVRSNDLMEAMGINPDESGGEMARNAHAIADAGWVKLGRKRINGKRTYLYVRQECYADWSGPGVDYHMGLPEERNPFEG